MEELAKLDIKYLHGVGPKRAEVLAQELGIRSYYDLLYHFPFRYIDRSKIHKIADLRRLGENGGDMPYLQLKGQFAAFATHGEGARRRLNALFYDGTGSIDVVWFNKVKIIQESLHTGVEYIIFGKPTPYNSRYSMTHPEVDAYKPGMESQGLTGVYNITDKMRNRSFTSRTIKQLVQNLLATLRHVDDPLPPDIIARYRFLPLHAALAAHPWQEDETSILLPRALLHPLHPAARLRLLHHAVRTLALRHGGQARHDTLLALERAYSEGRGGLLFQLPGPFFAELRRGSVRIFVPDEKE